MKNKWEKVIAAVLTASLLLGVLAVPPQDAQSASKNHMKKLKVQWDLKKGKKVYCDALFADVGKKSKSMYFKITKYKVSNAGKKGYKKLTLTCINRVTYKPTPSEVHKMVNSSYFKKTNILGANGDSAIVDYNSGISLKKKNKYNVKVKTKDWQPVNDKIYKDSHGCYVNFGDLKETITITYPEDYDGLCIGFYSDNQFGKSNADKKFLKGKGAFGKTSYYKKGKKNSHWMRVRASKKKKPTATSKPQATETPKPSETPSPSPSGNEAA